jgi:1-acyl-sn-glycerol-3-phosphate acyltransferase
MLSSFFRTSFFVILLISITWFHFIALILERIYLILTGKTKKQKEETAHLRSAKWGRDLFRFNPLWSIQISGKEKIPDSGHFVIVANHESATDMLALNYLQIQFRWLAKKEAFKIPCIGQAMTWSGYIPIQRGSRESHKHAIDLCKQSIEEKTPVLFFPEGTRSTLGYPKDFKVGAFKVAKEVGAPVLPIVLKGAGKLLKKGSLAPKKATMVVKILDPVSSPLEESIEDFTKRVEELIIKEHKNINT